jgi:hypothetical protein
VLFVVNRGTLVRQRKKEFDEYVSPVDNYTFGASIAWACASATTGPLAMCE